MSFSVKPLFFAITACFTAFFSSSVRLLMFLTSVTSGSTNVRTESLALTVLSAGMVPTLPSWLMFTVPSSATVMSSSVKFLSGLAALTASLTACFSSGVNLLVFSTRTGSFGGLKLFWTCFCSTVSAGANSFVLPSLLTMAVPSFPTLISAAVKFASGFALMIAAITASFSPDVNAFKSPTGVFAGLFKVSSASAFFSQTA